jgi:hypothetical protein
MGIFEAFYTDLFIWVAVGLIRVFAIVFILAFTGADIILADGGIFWAIV